MAKRDSGELFLTGETDDDGVDRNSTYESNGSTCSWYSDGGRLFGEPSTYREHHQIIQRRSTVRHGDELDDRAHRRADAAGGQSVIWMIDPVENRAVRAQQKRGPTTPSNRPSSKTASPNPPERRGEWLFGDETHQ